MRAEKLVNDPFSTTTVMLLAGGRGRRLEPLTDGCPKPLLPFASRYRVIDVTLSNALNSGARRVYVLTQYEAEQIAVYLREAWRKVGGPQSFARPLPAVPGRTYSGTASPLVQNLKFVAQSGAREILMLSGDHIYRMDYRKLLDFHRGRSAAATLATIPYPREVASSFGVVKIAADRRVVDFREKPDEPEAMPDRPQASLVSLGVYVFDVGALQACLQGDEVDIGADVVPRLLRTGRVYAYPFEGVGESSCWIDVGTIDSYFQAHQAVLDGAFALDDRRWPIRSGMIRSPRRSGPLEPDASIVDPTAVVASAELHRSFVGPGAIVGSDAYLRNVIVLPGGEIGAGAAVRNAIVQGDARVPDGETVGWHVRPGGGGYRVTEGGVVVVSGDGTRRLARPAGPGLVLVVDDDAAFRYWVRDVLEACGYGVVVVDGVNRAIRLALRHRSELGAVVCGRRLDMAPQALIRFVRDNLPSTAVVAHRWGGETWEPAPDGVLTAPTTADEVIRTVGESLRRVGAGTGPGPTTRLSPLFLRRSSVPPMQ